MKKIIATLLPLLIFFGTYCQKASIEAEIRGLEEKHIQAILQKNSATLQKIWTSGFMVNSPRNIVVTGGQVERVMSGALAYSSYHFEMEQIFIKGKYSDYNG